MSVLRKIAAVPAKGGAIVLGGALCAAFMATPAKAALSLTISEPGFAPVTGTVNGNTDTFIGAYGDFTTNIVIGFTNSATPGPVAQLQVQSLEVTNLSNTGSKNLTISLTDTSYNFPGAPGQKLQLTSSIGGTITSPIVGDKVTFQSTATPAGSGATSTPLQTYTSPATFPGAVAVTAPDQNTLFTETTSYGLNSVLGLTLSGPGESVNLSGSTSVTAPVPEPTIGTALVVAGFGLLRRRRRAI